MVSMDALMLTFALTAAALLATNGTACLPPVAAYTQVVSAVTSAALRAHLKAERFQVVTSVRGLPLGVRDGLQALFGGPVLEIAEPGSRFQATDLAMPQLPIRRLVVAGCSTDHCLVYYERGGIAHTWQVAVFHWTPAVTRLEGGGAAPGGLASVEEVRSALLSGAVKGPNRLW